MSRYLTPQERAQISTRPDGEPQSVPAPITGWNTRDSLTNMDPTDAITLDNWYPDYGGCILRNGFISYTQSALANAPVKGLMEYWSGSTHKFLAAAGSSIFDITDPSSVSELVTGNTSDIWDGIMFSRRLLMANGVDNAKIYDGSTISDVGITGVDISKIAGFFTYQRLLFFWLVNDDAFYWIPNGGFSGAASKYDLSLISEVGGNVVSMTKFSNDGGNGVLSFMVVALTSGEMIIFQGIDPAQSSVWSLVASYLLSAPVNPRAVYRYGAETYLTTADDHVPLQQQLAALKLGQAPPRSKISGAVAAAVMAGSGLYGWQAIYYGLGRRLIFNIPNGDGTFDQHVYNTSTQAWCRFTGMNAQVWGLYNKNLFFGDATGNVWQADKGSLDYGTQAIQANGQTAWSIFTTELRKRVAQTRAIMETDGNAAYNLGVGFDYTVVNVGSPIAPVNQGSPWNISPWNTSPWSPDFNIDPTWRGQGGTGQAISFRVSAASTLPMVWLRNDFIVEAGGTQ